MQYPYLYNIPKIPIQNVYNITQQESHLGNNFLTKAFIELLPGKYKPLQFNMVKNRLRLNDMLHGLIKIKKTDNKLNLSANEIGNNWREFMIIEKGNPYGYGDSSQDDLPFNFYSHLCKWPMIVDETKKIRPHKNAMLYNLRCYNLGYHAYINTTDDILNRGKSNMFRELEYYKYVTEHIVNKYISPNFVSYITEALDYKSKIKYKYFNEKKLGTFTNDIKDYITNNFDNMKNILITLKPLLDYYKSIGLFKIEHLFEPDVNHTEAHNLLINYFNSLNDPEKLYFLAKHIKDNPTSIEQVSLKNILLDLMVKINIGTDTDMMKNIAKLLASLSNDSIKLEQYPNCSLVVLTEAPHYNIYKWASPLYKPFGSHINMIQTGIHSVEVWNNILFQMMYTFSVLYKHEIYLKEMSLKRNIFIKDLVEFKNKGKWCYIINNIKYYIPNEGYMVLFDSSYSDYEELHNFAGNPSSFKLEKLYSDKDKYKINGPFTDIKDDDLKTSNNRKDAIWNKIKECLETFHMNLLGFSVYKPPQETLELINAIINDMNISTDKDNYMGNILFVKHFKIYLSNKIGKLLTIDESKYVEYELLDERHKGGIHVYDTGNTKEFVLYVDDNNNNNRAIIITKDNENKHIMKSVFKAQIQTYPYKLTNEEENIIETYRLK